MLGALVGLVVGQFRSRASLLAENELLRQQLAAAKSRLQCKRLIFTGSQRLTIALLTRWTASWRATVTLVQPATVLRPTSIGQSAFRCHSRRMRPSRARSSHLRTAASSPYPSSVVSITATSEARRSCGTQDLAVTSRGDRRRAPCSRDRSRHSLLRLQRRAKKVKASIGPLVGRSAVGSSFDQRQVTSPAWNAVDS